MKETLTALPEYLFDLPEHYEEVVDDKTADLTAPDIDSLNAQQKHAFDTMFNYVIDPAPKYRAVLFEGYAGTGKTYTIAQLIKKIIMVHHKKIAVTAPTNKAVKVLKRTTKMTHHLLEFRTIHSLLGLREDIDPDTGKISFVPSSDPDDKECDINQIDLLIVDEASMLDDELFKVVDERIEKGLKIIYMGDPVQIPPVNKSDSIPFIEAHRKTYNIHRVSLTDIVRQAIGNPILELATSVRTHIQDVEIPHPYITQLKDKTGIAIISKDDKDILFRLCDCYFGNERFKIDPDFIKVIAWTNKTVDFMNNKIRRLIYKDQIQYSSAEDKTGKLSKILIGEKLIADKPIMKQKIKPNGRMYETAVFTTNDEFEVESYMLENMEIYSSHSLLCYQAKVVMRLPDNKEKRETISILHESSESQFDFLVNNLKKSAINEKNREERANKWRLYYKIKNKFADVKYNYAITAHKSQGSTYENAIVIETDINYNRRLVERNRIKYVAFTRSRSLLFIVK